MLLEGKKDKKLDFWTKIGKDLMQYKANCANCNGWNHKRENLYLETSANRKYFHLYLKQRLNVHIIHSFTSPFSFFLSVSINFKVKKIRMLKNLLELILTVLLRFKKKNHRRFWALNCYKLSKILKKKKNKTIICKQMIGYSSVEIAQKMRRNIYQ